jgi:hypothetical protein
MDDNFYNDDDIREPDSVKTEQLLEDDIQAIEDPIYNILEQSKSDFDLIQEAQEQHMIENLIFQYQQRVNKFASIKQKCKKLLIFDRDNVGIYEVIISIIEMYENEQSSQYTTNKEQFDQIVSTLKSLRLTKEEAESFTKIIIWV